MNHDTSLRMHTLQAVVNARLAAVAYNTHHLDHLERVAALCLQLGRQLQADLTILEAAAWLHDIARSAKLPDKVCHARMSAEVAADILAGLAWPTVEIEPIVYAIRCHRYSHGIVPQTLEAKILQDADRLDALGAVGLARVLAHGLILGEPLYSRESATPFVGTCTAAHFHEKILRLKDGMHTEPARRIAEQRSAFTESFLQRLAEEIRQSCPHSSAQH